MTVRVVRDQQAAMRHVIHVGPNSFPTDLGAAQGGEGSGPTPHDLYDAALGACTALTVLLHAKHKQIPVTGIEVCVDRDASQEREGVYRNRRARIVRDLGSVPAYATPVGGAPVEVEPPSKRARRRAAEDPGEQLSKEEFDELVRDIEPEIAEQPKPAGAGAGRRSTRRAASTQVQPRAASDEVEDQSPAPKDDGDPAADLTPEDLVLKQDSSRREKPRRPRNRRHGRSR